MPDQLDPQLDPTDDELQALRALRARVAPIDPMWQVPPDDLWGRIAADAGVDAAATPPASWPGAAPAAGPADGSAPPPGPSSAAGSGASEVTDLGAARDRRGGAGGRAPRRGLPPWLLVAAAVVAVLAVGGLVVGVLGSGDDRVEVVAVGDLEPLLDVGTGRAELVDHDGTMELRLQISDVDAPDGFLEVWMIDPEVTRLISLGPVRADGVYALPQGMDPGEFPIVDVSREPIDGDPAHSGASVLRGQLPL